MLKGGEVDINKAEKTVYIEIEPELSACVETKARQEYEKTLSEVLKKGEEGKLLEKLEILRLFLETTDFSGLRKEYERYLLQGKRVKFILHLVKGKPKYEVEIV